MRIAFLPSSYFPESVGGTEMYVHHLAQGLTARGHDVAVVCHGEQVGTTADDGYEVQRLPPHLPRRRADLYHRSTGQSPPGFAGFLDQWQPDVVHFHAFTLGAGLDHVRALKNRGVPYLITYHTPTFSCQRGSLLRWGRIVCDGKLDARRCASCSLNGHGFSRPLAALLALSPLSSRLPEGPWITRLALPALLDKAHDNWHEFMSRALHISWRAPIGAAMCCGPMALPSKESAHFGRHCRGRRGRATFACRLPSARHCGSGFLPGSPG